jgi:hypothetical protein
LDHVLVIVAFRQREAVSGAIEIFDGFPDREFLVNCMRNDPKPFE